MEQNKNTDPKSEKAEVKKQNQDYPNIPASSERISKEKTVKKEIHQTSRLHKEGKTDNTEKKRIL